MSEPTTTRYFLTGLPKHRKGNLGAYLREQGISFNRLHDHGSSAHVSIANEDLSRFLELKTFLGKPIESEPAKPLVTRLRTDIAYLVLESSDALLSEKGYSVKLRVTAPKDESAKVYKLVAVRTNAGVKTRALVEHKPLASAQWVSDLPVGSLVFSIPNLYAVGAVLEDFATVDTSVVIKRTDSMIWASVSPLEVPEEDQPLDGGETEDEADDPPPKKATRSRK